MYTLERTVRNISITSCGYLMERYQVTPSYKFCEITNIYLNFLVTDDGPAVDTGLTIKHLSGIAL